MSSTANLAAIVYVYEQVSRPHRTICVYHDDAARFSANPRKWRHTATLEPAAWIEDLMNHAEKRQEKIEGLMAKRRTR